MTHKIKILFFRYDCYDDWISQFLQLEIPQVFIYCTYMSTGVWWTFWEFQKRSSLYFNNNGTPKLEPVIPEGAQISPITPENKALITEQCIKDKATRTTLNKLDLHRIPPQGLAGMMAYSLIELW